MFKREGGNTVKLIDFSLTRKYDPKVETKISQGTAEYVGKMVIYMLLELQKACIYLRET